MCQAHSHTSHQSLSAGKAANQLVWETNPRLYNYQKDGSRSDRTSHFRRVTAKRSATTEGGHVPAGRAQPNPNQQRAQHTLHRQIASQRHHAGLAPNRKSGDILGKTKKFKKESSKTHHLPSYQKGGSLPVSKINCQSNSKTVVATQPAAQAGNQRSWFNHCI